MNHDEAKNILLLYRSSADLADAEIGEALEVAKNDPELARWFEEHCARQNALRDKFRTIVPPAGLKEQIIAEELAKKRSGFRRERFIAVAAVAAIVVSLIALAPFWLPHNAPPPDNTLAIFESQMVRIALTPSYGMDIETNDPEQIRAYLARNQAVADYVLPPGLQKVAVTGCAIEGWQNTKASMICFRTGKPLPAGRASDLWLFVADRSTLKDAPQSGELQIKTVNGLMTAAWSQDGKVYLLGTEGDRQIIQQFL